MKVMSFGHSGGRGKMQLSQLITGFILYALAVFLLPISGVVAEANANPSPSKIRTQGDIAFTEKKYEDALHFYSQAIKLEPNNEKNFYKRFRVYDRLKKTRNALSDLNHALTLNPDYSSAYALRARLFMTLGRCPEAAKDYETVLKLKPNHGDASKMITKAKECAQEVSNAENLMRSKQWTAAERQLDLALHSTGNSAHLKMLRAESRFNQGKYFEAIADTGDVLKLEKESIEALLLRGKAYYRTAEHDMTMRHLREALKFDPEHKETKEFFRKVKKLLKHVERAEKSLKQQNHQGLLDAVSSYKDALAVDPEHLEYAKTLHLSICRLEAKMKHTDPAKAACNAALAIDNSLVDAYVIIAELLLKSAEDSDEFEEVVRLLQKARELDEKNQKVGELLHRAEVGLKQSKEKNYYKILEVKRNADSSAIKKAYRKLAKQYHPDKHQDKSKEELSKVEKKFQDVAEAYEVLSDADLRAKYDRGEPVFENQGNQQQQRRGGFPFHFQQQGGHRRRGGFGF